MISGVVIKQFTNFLRTLCSLFHTFVGFLQIILIACVWSRNQPMWIESKFVSELFTKCQKLRFKFIIKTCQYEITYLQNLLSNTSISHKTNIMINFCNSQQVSIVLTCLRPCKLHAVLGTNHRGPKQFSRLLVMLHWHSMTPQMYHL